MNNLVLTAQIVEVSTLRYSPAGLPVVDVKLVHDSIEVDSGTPRKINVSIKSVAIGHLAERLIQLPIHSTWTFTGFLASSKNSKSIFFHIQSFQTDS